MAEKYDKVRKNLELAMSQLKGARTQVEVLSKQLYEGSSREAQLQEEVRRLQELVEDKDKKLAVMALELDSLLYKSSPEFDVEVLRQASSFYTDGFTVCAEQFKNLGNLPLVFNYDFLDMRADGLGRVGGVDPPRVSQV
ncbi:hypothetical protein Salat_0672300 [Sesamum alatum]|uniref:Uncharacterized protein n=1 Tax=Sesamum alatum TaxID=300844 RepID=A0AAE1YR12_9LAMI|nr:hypothetical protein Salat_0672300 [Sesamum alatum]